jgi:hypothetical protein
MISAPYPSKGTAKADAKLYAQANGIKKISLLIDAGNRQFHFSDGEQPSNMLVFAKIEQRGGKWQDKVPGRKNA